MINFDKRPLLNAHLLSEQCVFQRYFLFLWFCQTLLSLFAACCQITTPDFVVVAFVAAEPVCTGWMLKRCMYGLFMKKSSDAFTFTELQHVLSEFAPDSHLLMKSARAANPTNFKFFFLVNRRHRTDRQTDGQKWTIYFIKF